MDSSSSESSNCRHDSTFVPPSSPPEFKLVCFERRKHLHFIVTGINGPDALLAYGKEIIDQSRLLGFKHILVEDKLSGPRMEPIDLYPSLAEISKLARLNLRVVAAVDEQLGDTLEITEAVFVNRGLNFGSFRAVPEAETWLLDQIGDD